MSDSPVASTSMALLDACEGVARHETVTTSEPPPVTVSIDVDIAGTVWAEIIGEEIQFRCMWIGCTQRCATSEELQEHVQGHVAVYAQYMSEGEPWICHIVGCHLESASLEDFNRHIGLHLYHAEKVLMGLAIVRHRLQPEPGAPLPHCGCPPLLRIEIKADNFVCEWDSCKTTFSDVSAFREHVSAHVDTMDIAGGTLDHCRWMMEEGTWCAFPAHKKSLLKRHMARHSGNKACACPTCGQLFANNTKLLGHMLRKQEADPELTCNFCHRSFPTFAMLREHCRRHVRKVRCPQCALALENTTDLRRHLSTVHEKNREQECSVCHKSFTQRSDLRKHMAVHKDALEFVCGDCGQAFRWRKQLAEHERTHKEGYIASPYICHLCGSRYKRGSSLSQHFTDVHSMHTPEGFSRFQYKKCADGLYRLQTKQFLSRELAQDEGLG